MARSFNGSSDKIDVDAAHVTNGLGTAFSIALWVNSSIANASAKNPYSEGNTGGAGPFFQLQGDASGHLSLAARSAGSGSSDSKTTTAVVFDGTWHHCCVTQDTSGNIAIYCDGILDSTLARTGLSNNVSQVFNTCSLAYLHRNTTGQFYGGALAHVANWTRQLSSGEGAQLAAGAIPSLLSPDHYWQLRGTTSPEPDLGSSPVNGTVTGTTQLAGAGPPVHIAGVFPGRVARNHLLRR